MSTSQLSPRLQEAVAWAVRLHGADARKGSNVPVLAHLLGVCALVQQDGGDEDEAIAALLHDALEDKPEQITREQIGSAFGPRVLSLVATATDTPAHYAGGPKPAWRARKEGYLERLRHSDPALLRVCAADKVDNVRAMLADYQRLGEGLWQRFNAGREEQLWYLRRASASCRAAGLRGPLLDELERLVEELVRLVATRPDAGGG